MIAKFVITSARSLLFNLGDAFVVIRFLQTVYTIFFLRKYVLCVKKTQKSVTEIDEMKKYMNI